MPRARSLAVMTAAVALTAALVPLPSATAAAPATSSTSVRGPSLAAPARPTVHVGSLDLRPCSVMARALCGSITRAWDPTGAVPGTVKVGFAFVPARDGSRPALGTFVPHEGGPGYATTSSASSYAELYGPLLRRRNMLLVDQRGTGRTAPIDCRELQDLHGPYAPAAATCAARLGARSHLYGSALSADDLAAVVGALGLGKVDVYGDSYGTFFAQVYAGRHPGQVRSVVVDAAYPTYGENAWYATQGPAMRRSFNAVCERTPACAARSGSTMKRLTKVIRQLRAAPITARVYGADAKRHRVTLDPAALAYVAFNATYVPATYRELDAALRAHLRRGDDAPLLRLLAEANFPGGGLDVPADYSEGADAAVSCQDYPQLYDMRATPAQRSTQFAAAIAARERTHPGTYAPFTIRDYLGSDWEMQSWCRSWPSAPTAYPQGPVRPPGGSYSRAVPVLVLSGELDSITTPAEGGLVAAQWPKAQQVVVANSLHVTALGDTDDCAGRIVRYFVTHPRKRVPAALRRCAADVPPIRATPAFRTRSADAPPAVALPGSTSSRVRLSAARTAAETVADVVDRWFQTYEVTGVGLRGGTFRMRGDSTVRFTLHRVKLVRDLALKGTIRWDRYANQVTVNLRLRGSAAVSGRLSGAWSTRAEGARAVLAGRLGGRPVVASLPAP